MRGVASRLVTRHMGLLHGLLFARMMLCFWSSVIISSAIRRDAGGARRGACFTGLAPWVSIAWGTTWVRPKSYEWVLKICWLLTNKRCSCFFCCEETSAAATDLVIHSGVMPVVVGRVGVLGGSCRW